MGAAGKRVSYIFVVFSLFFMIFSCGDNSIDPRDRDFQGNYFLKPTWSGIDTANLTVFKLYQVPYSQGSDKFSSISAYTSADGFLDTALFISKSQNGTLSLYFLSTGKSMLIIDCLRPNKIHVMDTVFITVKNPYLISGDTVVGENETASFSLLPQPTPAATGLNLSVEWTLNDTGKAPLGPASPYQITPIRSGKLRISASLVDTVNNHRLIVDSVHCNVPGFRPVIDSLKVVNKILHPGDSASFHLYASDRDGGALKVFAATAKAGIWSDTFTLASSLSYQSVLTGTKPMTDTGTFVFGVKVVDNSGLSSKTVYDSFKVTLNITTVDTVAPNIALVFPVCRQPDDGRFLL